MQKINTSSKGKQADYAFAFGNWASFTALDLAEIKSQDRHLVSAYKALMAGNSVLVDDTALVIDGADVGTDVKWMLANIQNYIGKKATFFVTLSIKRDKKIYVYEGRQDGTICSKDGDGFGFDPYFKPLGCERSFAWNRYWHCNPRSFAIYNFRNCRPCKVYNSLPDWQGDWQG